MNRRHTASSSGRSAPATGRGRVILETTDWFYALREWQRKAGVPYWEYPAEPTRGNYWLCANGRPLVAAEVKRAAVGRPLFARLSFERGNADEWTQPPNPGETMSTTSKIMVVRLGMFAGGSFGVPGDPRECYEMWAVECPRNSWAGHLPQAGFVFSSERAAERKADEERAYEQGRADERDAAAKRAAADAHHRDQLARGWDGYRFVGVDEGRRILAATA